MIILLYRYLHHRLHHALCLQSRPIHRAVLDSAWQSRPQLCDWSAPQSELSARGNSAGSQTEFACNLMRASKDLIVRAVQETLEDEMRNEDCGSRDASERVFHSKRRKIDRVTGRRIGVCRKRARPTGYSTAVYVLQATLALRSCKFIPVSACWLATNAIISVHTSALSKHTSVLTTARRGAPSFSCECDHQCLTRGTLREHEQRGRGTACLRRMRLTVRRKRPSLSTRHVAACGLSRWRPALLVLVTA